MPFERRHRMPPRYRALSLARSLALSLSLSFCLSVCLSLYLSLPLSTSFLRSCHTHALTWLR